MSEILAISVSRNAARLQRPRNALSRAQSDAEQRPDHHARWRTVNSVREDAVQSVQQEAAALHDVIMLVTSSDDR